MTSFLRLLVICIFLLATFSVQASAEKVTLYLNWKHQFQYAGFYMAREKGFYDEVNLDVTIREYDSRTGDLVDRVTSWPGRYGLSKTDLVLAYMEGAEVRMLANFLKHSPLALVARSDIREPEQLRASKDSGGDPGYQVTQLHPAYS
jgi:hypothetical protein